jgi:hypothetical protein
LPGWRRIDGCGKTASVNSIPACNSFSWHSWLFCLKDFEQALRMFVNWIVVHSFPLWLTPELSCVCGSKSAWRGKRQLQRFVGHRRRTELPTAYRDQSLLPRIQILAPHSDTPEPEYAQSLTSPFSNKMIERFLRASRSNYCPSTQQPFPSARLRLCPHFRHLFSAIISPIFQRPICLKWRLTSSTHRKRCILFYKQVYNKTRYSVRFWIKKTSWMKYCNLLFWLRLAYSISLATPCYPDQESINSFEMSKIRFQVFCRIWSCS